MNYKEELVGLLFQAGLLTTTAPSDEGVEMALRRATQLLSSRVQEEAAAEALGDGPFFIISAMIASPLTGQGQQTSIFSKEHPVIWAAREEERARLSGKLVVVVLQFFAEIPKEAYLEGERAVKATDADMARFAAPGRLTGDVLKPRPGR